MRERIFRKGYQVRYAYNPAQAVRLHADGWVEDQASPSEEASADPESDPIYADWGETAPEDPEEQKEEKRGSQ